MRIFFIIFTVFFCSFLYSEELPFESVRVLGMGGTSIGVSNDENAYMYNPAGLGLRQKFHMTYDSTGFEINNNTWNLYEDYVNVIDPLVKSSNATNIIKIYEKAKEYINTEERIKFINSLGLSYKGFALNLDMAEELRTSIKTSGSPLGIYLSAKDRLSWDGSLGWGFKVPYHWKNGWIMIGVLGRYIQLYDLDIPYAGIGLIEFNGKKYISSGTDFSTMFDIHYYKDSTTNKSLWDVLNLDYLKSIKPLNGYGCSSGVLVQIVKDMRAGITVRDIYFDSNISKIYGMKIDFGFYYKLKTKFFRKKGESLLFAFDIIDILKKEDSFLKTRIGIEYKPYRWLTLRMGLLQGYPTFGFSTGPIDYAFTARELGSYPGQKRDASHFLSFRFKM